MAKQPDEYVAGTDPTNSASSFSLTISNLTLASQKTVDVQPRLNDRSYTVQFRTNFVTGGFSNLTTTVTSDAGSTRSSRTLTQLIKPILSSEHFVPIKSKRLTTLQL